MFMQDDEFCLMSFTDAIDKVLKRQFVFKIKVVPNSFYYGIMCG